MKKLILVICCLISCVFVLSACKEKPEDKFWEQTSTAFNHFLEEDVKMYKDGFTYNNKINSNIQNKYATYADIISVYTPVYEMSFNFLYSFSGILNIKPNTKDKNVKTAFVNFEKQLKVSAEKIKNFVATDLIIFNNGIEGDTQVSAESIISLNVLSNYKKSFINLSTNLLDLSESFLNLYTTYYNDIPVLKTEDGFTELTIVQYQNYAKLAIAKSIISTLKPTISYINNFKGKFILLETNKFLDCLKNYKTLLAVNPETYVNSSKLISNWQEVFKIYNSDLDCFTSIINTVDFKVLGEDYAFDAAAYASGTGDSYAYANINKINSFSSASVITLYQFTKNIISVA